MHESDNEAPHVQLRVFRDGLLRESIECASVDEAEARASVWADREPGVKVEIDDLTYHHRGDQILAPEPDVDPLDDPYRP